MEIKNITKTQNDLASHLKEKFNLSLGQSKDIVNFIFDDIVDQLANGYDVRVSKFAHFKLREATEKRMFVPEYNDYVNLQPRVRLQFHKFGRLINIDQLKS